MHAHESQSRQGGEQRPPRQGSRPDSPLDRVRKLAALAGNLAVSRALDEEEHSHGPGCGHRAAGEESTTDAAVQRKATLASALASPARPIESRIREKAERVYPMRFDHVRWHDNPVAQRAAKEFGAKALAVGPHILVAEPNLSDEDKFHEIDHTYQTAMGEVAGTDDGSHTKVSHPTDPYEVKAAANGRKVARGGAPDLSLPGRPAPVTEGGQATEHNVQRSPRNWAQSREIRGAEGLRAGLLPGSRWPRVVKALEAYGTLAETDLPARRAALEAVEDAVETWEQNHGRTKETSNTRAKLRAVAEIRSHISQERREIREMETPQRQAAPQRAAPMAIGGGGGGSSRAQRPSVASSSASDSSSLPYGDSASPLRPLNETSSTRQASQYKDAPGLPPGVTCVIHRTGQAEKINRQGIRPERGRGGIGLPETQQTDTSRFYAYGGGHPATGSSIAMDAAQSGADRVICVLSGPSVRYEPDVNYGGDGRGAVSYAGAAPPVRHAEEQPAGPLSFPLPLGSGSTLQRVTDFLNGHRGPGQDPLTPQAAKAMIYGHLVRQHTVIAMAQHMD
ncbi:eCIS core domain-containing protein [Streptomyces flavofungini]|uniref:eCIS core domain-containing protein n=1 Tax=Streptomyces flavofungini TaxID=68200 RepID=UPI0034DEB1A0